MIVEVLNTEVVTKFFYAISGVNFWAKKHVFRVLRRRSKKCIGNIFKKPLTKHCPTSIILNPVVDVANHRRLTLPPIFTITCRRVIAANPTC